MFVLVVGGGKVGYYLTKELIDAGGRLQTPASAIPISLDGST